MALRVCKHWRYPLFQISQKLKTRDMLAPKIQNQVSVQNYRNLSFGDYKMGISEKIYILSLPIILFIFTIDTKKLKRMIKGEDIYDKYNAELVAAAFPNAEIVMRVVEKVPDNKNNNDSQK